MRNFVLYRTTDVSGVSGTGTVAEGVIFSNGKVVIAWVTDYSSLGVYNSIEEVEAIHGHSGSTSIVYLD